MKKVSLELERAFFQLVMNVRNVFRELEINDFWEKGVITIGDGHEISKAIIII